MEILTLFVMPDFAEPEIWMSLLTLIFLEIVLGVDNIIFISITAGKLPKEEQGKATNVGLVLAMVLRIVLLFGISCRCLTLEGSRSCSFYDDRYTWRLFWGK